MTDIMAHREKSPQLGPGMSLAYGGSVGVYRVAHSCGWTSNPINPDSEPESWRNAIENHVCPPLPE